MHEWIHVKTSTCVFSQPIRIFSSGKYCDPSMSRYKMFITVLEKDTIPRWPDGLDGNSSLVDSYNTYEMNKVLCHSIFLARHNKRSFMMNFCPIVSVAMTFV